jgi:hypothetical protein
MTDMIIRKDQKVYEVKHTEHPVRDLLRDWFMRWRWWFVGCAVDFAIYYGWTHPGLNPWCCG